MSEDKKRELKLHALLADASPELPEDKTGYEAPFVQERRQSQEELEKNLMISEKAFGKLIEGGKQ